MRLESLTLAGFRSYAQASTLSFNDVPAAVVVGPNGSGKSTIAEALEWALWGTSRTSAVDGVVCLSEDKATVSLIFNTSIADRWKIDRWRTRDAGGLDLWHASPNAGWNGWGPWEARSAKRVSETQEAIDLVVGSRDALLSSCILRQGDQGRFASAAPAQRRKILREIVGLGRWEEAQRSARDKVSEHVAAAAALEASGVGPAGAHAAHESARTAAEAEASALTALALASETRNIAEAERDSARKAAAGARVTLSSIRQRHDELSLLHADLRRLDGEKRAVLASVDEWERSSRACLSDEAFGSAVAQLERLEDAWETIAAARGTREVLQAELASCRDAYTREREQAKAHDAYLTRQREAAGVAPGESVDEIIQQVADELRNDEAWIGRLGELERARSKVADRKAEISSRLREIDRAKERYASIASVPCLSASARPKGMVSVCPLASSSYVDIPALEEEAFALGEELCSLVQPDDPAVVARSAHESAAKHRVRLEALQALRSVPARSVADLAEVRRRGEELARGLAELPTVASVLGVSDALGVDDLWLARQLEEVRRSVEGLLALREKVAAWDADAAAAEVVRIEAEVVRIEAEVARIEEAAKAAVLATQRAEELEREADAAGTALYAASRGEGNARMVHEEARRSHARQTEVLAGLLAGLERLEEHRREIEIWRATLTVAMTAPTILLENFAIPTLEAAANRVLEQISTAGLRVEIRTQAERKSGEGQKEVLEIVAHDENGARAYEAFSGGERFRLDIALALGQHALLGRSASAADWLIIDEGWGTLDQQGLDALSDVFAGLQKRYSTLLIITHLPDVADCLPRSIRVTKGAEGSRLDVR